MVYFAVCNEGKSRFPPKKFIISITGFVAVAVAFHMEALQVGTRLET